MSQIPLFYSSDEFDRKINDFFICHFLLFFSDAIQQLLQINVFVSLKIFYCFTLQFNEVDI